MKNYHIERMNKEEVALAIDWAANEGWNPGLHDADCFYQADPTGFFAGKLNHQIVALGSAVIYDDNFAFCGLYIVDKAYRGQGYGLELTKARLAYIGQRNAGLDGVMEMVDKYSTLGYQFAHNNARYCLDKAHHTVRPDHHILPLNKISFTQLSQYDRRHFPADRQSFLRAWIQQKQSLALGYVKDDTLQGYGVIRACREGYKIAPLFADTREIADSLLNNLLHHARNKVVYLDIAENNPCAIELVKHHHMTKVFATARMYLKEEPKLTTEGIYGITSFELG